MICQPCRPSPSVEKRRRRVVLLVVGTLAAAAALGWRPALVAWRLREGERALSLGDPEAAAAKFRAAEALDPRHGRTQFLLARVQRRLGDSAGVYERLHRAHANGFPGDRLEREWILAQA